MPAKEIDYSTTVIYKIVCNDLAITDLYIGSTTNFRNRKYSHTQRCNNKNDKKHNLKIYQTIRDNGGWLNWSMLQIEAFPCANGNEARTRERYWYEQLNATLNTLYPIRGQKERYDEYYEKNIDNIKEYRKEYKTINKDKIRQQQKDYTEKTKDARHMYYVENKDKIKEQHKKYRDANKDKIKERQSRTYICECGSMFKIGEKSQHFKSLKHLAFIAQKNNVET
jgi:hypothetical protein